MKTLEYYNWPRNYVHHNVIANSGTRAVKHGSVTNSSGFSVVCQCVPSVTELECYQEMVKYITYKIGKSERDKPQLLECNRFSDQNY